MTECENAEVRDLLPDYVADGLDASASAAVVQHLGSCGACEHEVALLRLARAVRSQAVHIDVDSIVARLVLPSSNLASQPLSNEPASAVSLGNAASRPVIALNAARRPRATRGMWQLAAAVGVVALGSLSILTARFGQVPLPVTMRSDTALLGEAAESATVTRDTLSRAAPAVGTAVPPNGSASVGRTSNGSEAQSAGTVTARAAVVSVGDLSDFTDAELQKMLDRLDRWDGASSSDVMPSVPIVRVGERGSSQ